MTFFDLSHIKRMANNNHKALLILLVFVSFLMVISTLITLRNGVPLTSGQILFFGFYFGVMVTSSIKLIVMDIKQRIKRHKEGRKVVCT